MSIYDIENIKRRKLFQMLIDAGEHGICFLDALHFVKVSSFYKRISDIEHMGYPITRIKRKVFDDVSKRYRKISANGQAATCPVCMSETTSTESKEENQHGKL